MNIGFIIWGIIFGKLTIVPGVPEKMPLSEKGAYLAKGHFFLGHPVLLI